MTRARRPRSSWAGRALTPPPEGQLLPVGRLVSPLPRPPQRGGGGVGAGWPGGHPHPKSTAPLQLLAQRPERRHFRPGPGLLPLVQPPRLPVPSGGGGGLCLLTGRRGSPTRPPPPPHSGLGTPLGTSAPWTPRWSTRPVPLRPGAPSPPGSSAALRPSPRQPQRHRLSVPPSCSLLRVHRPASRSAHPYPTRQARTPRPCPALRPPNRVPHHALPPCSPASRLEARSSSRSSPRRLPWLAALSQLHNQKPPAAFPPHT